MTDEDHDHRFEFEEADKARYIAARERLQFAPFGIITGVAREVGVKRQYAHAVIFDEDTFTKYRSVKARQIWQLLERRVAENDIIPVVEAVVKSLQAKTDVNQVQLKMSSRLFAFLKRRLARLEIAYQVTSDDLSPATYTFIPIKPVAKAV